MENDDAREWAERVAAHVCREIGPGDVIPELEPPLSTAILAGLRKKGLVPEYRSMRGWVATDARMATEGG